MISMAAQTLRPLRPAVLCLSVANQSNTAIFPTNLSCYSERENTPIVA